jgi:hypothetical protein
MDRHFYTASAWTGLKPTALRSAVGHDPGGLCATGIMRRRQNR